MTKHAQRPGHPAHPGAGRRHVVLGTLGIASALGCLPAPVLAQTAADDPVEFFVAQTVTHDSNLFRISRDRDPASFIGDSDKSDTHSSTVAGVLFDVPVSRQRFQGEASLSANRFRRFSELDYTGRTLRATWLINEDDPLHGQLGIAHTRTLSSFTTAQTRSSNLVTTRRLFGDLSAPLTPDWELRAQAARREHRNDTAAREIDDVNVTDAGIDLRYLGAPGNSVGLALGVETGRFPDSPLDRDYRQHSVGLAGEWQLTGKSQVAARIDRTHRRYDLPGSTDFSGTTMRVNYALAATEKLSFNLVAQRELIPVEDVETSTVLAKGLSFYPTLELSDKLRLAANLGYSERDYQDAGPSRRDRVRVYGLSLTYRPLRALTLTLQGQRDQRTSNLALADYAANVVSLTARLSF